MYSYDVVVVGGGLAGMRAAIEVNRYNLKVGLVSKVHPLRSHSIAAQGGINGALGNHHRGIKDSIELHTFDTIKGSDYLADQDCARRLCENAPTRIRELEHWGCPFSRTPEGKIAQRPFGGAGFPRTAYAADRTGHVLIHTLYEQCVRHEQGSERADFVFHDEFLVTSLIVHNGQCCGIVGIHQPTGKLEVIKANAVILGTGGFGRIYGNTTNALINTGMGVSIAYWAGVPIKDMEFVQFHPTTLFGNNILMTEGCRGEGGYLINDKGDRFMANYSDSAKAMEVAPRDITSRNIWREVLAGRGINGKPYVYLDLRHLGAEKISTRLPGIRDICLNFMGIDPIDSPIPVQPGTHYAMGGIDTDIDGATVIPGLYAAGECACVSVHGANRLGGNSLLDTLVFGQVSGEAAAKRIQGGLTAPADASVYTGAEKKEKERIDALLNATGTEEPAQLKQELNDIMAENVFIFREEKPLAQALVKVKELQSRYKNIFLRAKGTKFNQDLLWAMELKGSLDCAEAICLGALNRKESRGSHFRTDFPTRNDAEFLHHTLCHYDPVEARLEKKPVTLGLYEPKERKY